MRPIIDADGHLDERPEEIIDCLDPPLHAEAIVGRGHGLFPSWQATENRARTLLHGESHPGYRLDPTPEMLRRYPHQLSGGQQQRIGLAMAFCCRPSLIVLDEPTTGLDVVTQARILEELVRLCADEGLAMAYVTHDLAVVAQSLGSRDAAIGRLIGNLNTLTGAIDERDAQTVQFGDGCGPGFFRSPACTAFVKMFISVSSGHLRACLPGSRPHPRAPAVLRPPERTASSS